MEITGRDKAVEQSGTYTVTKLKNDGSTYIGSFKNKDGKEPAIRIRILQD